MTENQAGYCFAVLAAAQAGAATWAASTGDFGFSAYCVATFVLFALLAVRLGR